MSRTRVRYLNESVVVDEPHGSATSGSQKISRAQPGDPYDFLKLDPLAYSVSKEIQYRETMTDVEIANFHVRKRQGEILPTNSMSREVVCMATGLKSISSTTEAHTSLNKIQGWYMASYDHRRVSVTATIPSASNYKFKASEINDAKILAKARLHSQGMDWLTSAVEGRKTLAMIAGLKRNLTRAVKALVQRVMRDIRRKRLPPPESWAAFLDYIESAWLELRFGWRILFFDLTSLVNWMDRLSDEKLIVGRFRTEASQEVVVRDTASEFTVDHVTRRLHVGYPGTLNTRLLGYSNPLNTAWDVTPFSLVLDWFFDVQAQVLALTSAPKNVQAHPDASFVQQDVRVVRVTQAKMRELSLRPGYQGTLVPTHHATAIPIRAEYSNRVVAGNPQLSWPPYVGGPSGYQWLDLAALLRPMYKAFTEVRPR